MNVNDLVNSYGVVVAATDGETPCGNYYVITWNGNLTFNLHCVYDGGFEEVDVENIEDPKCFRYEKITNTNGFDSYNQLVDFGQVKEYAQNWLKKIITEENNSLDELLKEV